jgi:hypothetical protein
MPRIPVKSAEQLLVVRNQPNAGMVILLCPAFNHLTDGTRDPLLKLCLACVDDNSPVHLSCARETCSFNVPFLMLADQLGQLFLEV